MNTRFLSTLASLAFFGACTKEPHATPSSSATHSVSSAKAASAPAPRQVNDLDMDAADTTAGNKGIPGMAASTPIILRVEALKNAWLENASSEPRYVLHTSKFQPSRLRLYAKDGTELEPADARDRMKFDTKLSKADYKELSPNARLQLFQPRIKVYGGSYELIWGPFSFSALAQGEYSATLEWISERNDYVDEAGSMRKLDGVWLGTIRSARFVIAVP